MVQTRPDIAFVGTFFNFGDTPVGTLQTLTWEITNIGDGNSGAFQILNTNGVDFSFTVNGQSGVDTFCQDLAPNEACSMTLRYTPQTLGSHVTTFEANGFALQFTAVGQGI